jgi:hypothetical protein
MAFAVDHDHAEAEPRCDERVGKADYPCTNDRDVKRISWQTENPPSLLC